MNRIKNIIIKTLCLVRYWRCASRYSQQYKELLNVNNLPNKPCEGEDEWQHKWSVLDKANPVYYRLFSQYIGKDSNIVPEDICHNYIETALNPSIYVPYYSDKNIFDKLFKEGTMPRTILRKMGGGFLDAKYMPICVNNNSDLHNILSQSNVEKIVIKPSVDGESGRGVKLFQKAGDNWFELGTNKVLTLDSLNDEYKDEIIVQECMEQADYMSYFNQTSVNTLRLTVYRSVKTNKCHVTSAIMRIGGKGSLVDNAHAGGGYVGILEDGTLCNKVLNQYGQSCTIFNDIDFSKKHNIPNWDKVIEFAKYVGESIPHLRLLALDIMVDKNGEPHLIEFNSSGYSMWLFQFTMGSAFGKYTDEIIEYCAINKHKATKSFKINS